MSELALPVVNERRAWAWSRIGASALICIAGCGAGPTGPVTDAPWNGLTVLAYAQATPIDLAIDAEHVYWVNLRADDEGGVMMVPKTGGPTRALVRGQRIARKVAVGSNAIYWIAPTMGGAGFDVWKAGLAGENPQALVSGMAAASTLVAVDNDIYWSSADGGIRRTASAGGTTEEVAPGFTDVGRFAVDSKGIYWIDGVSHGETANIYGKEAALAPRNLASSPQATDIAIDETYVYWSDSTSIHRVPRSAGSPALVVAAAAESLASDGKSIFFTLPDTASLPADSGQGPPLRIMQVPIEGGQPKEVAQSDSVVHLSCDETSLYWSDLSRETVFELVK
jgi:hypothetical protein